MTRAATAASAPRGPRYRWFFRLGDKRGQVLANTRSEARAAIRKALNWPRPMVLPSAVILSKEPA